VSTDGTTIESVLERSRRLGFLGPGSVRVHIEHARAFALGFGATPRRVLDLGSGGGVPGLVLAAEVWTGSEFVLLDAGERRIAFLEGAVADLGLAPRVGVVRARAEVAGRDPQLRGSFDAVVARGFGPPAVTAECGAPFLRPGGTLVVSDPPVDGEDAPLGAVSSTTAPAARLDRWPAEGLARLGLVVERVWTEPFHHRALRLEHPCPDRYPRRDGVPARRPLF
jgi:16S rRNA (guanine527-N7)-methyltransferase